MKFVGGGVGAGVGVGVGVGERYGEGVGEGEGEGEGVGVGVTCCDTFQIHVCIAVPFSFVATADTFHVPATALVFV
ncbi:MAG: hypothetical protein N2V76_04590 [Methanophagales archaeon]|nr:hypothetical protein [Methanophagales archaeon]